MKKSINNGGREIISIIGILYKQSLILRVEAIILA